MAVTVQSIEADALQLSESELEELVERLVARMQPSPTLHPEWRAEIQRRLADLDAGRATLIPADEAMTRLDRHIRERRSSKA